MLHIASQTAGPIGRGGAIGKKKIKFFSHGPSASNTCILACGNNEYKMSCLQEE